MPVKKYTTAEVAKILHRTEDTIRKMVYRGELGCFGSSRPRGTGRPLKIGRTHIRAYMLQHLGNFSDSELTEWGVIPEVEPFVTQPEESACGMSQYSGDSYVCAEPSSQSTSVPYKTYFLHLNDRIAVGNITAETVVKIVEAIMRDPVCDVTTFKIDRME